MACDSCLQLSHFRCVGITTVLRRRSEVWLVTAACNGAISGVLVLHQHRKPAVGSVVAVRGSLAISHLPCTANSNN